MILSRINLNSNLYQQMPLGTALVTLSSLAVQTIMCPSYVGRTQANTVSRNILKVLASIFWKCSRILIVLHKICLWSLNKNYNLTSLTFPVFLDMAEGCANLHFNLGKFHSSSRKTFWYIYTQTYLGVFITIVVIQIISTLYLYQE